MSSELPPEIVSSELPPLTVSSELPPLTVSSPPVIVSSPPPLTVSLSPPLMVSSPPLTVSSEELPLFMVSSPLPPDTVSSELPPPLTVSSLPPPETVSAAVEEGFNLLTFSIKTSFNPLRHSLILLVKISSKISGALFLSNTPPIRLISIVDFTLRGLKPYSTLSIFTLTFLTGK